MYGLEAEAPQTGWHKIFESHNAFNYKIWAVIILKKVSLPVKKPANKL